VNEQYLGSWEVEVGGTGSFLLSFFLLLMFAALCLYPYSPPSIVLSIVLSLSVDVSFGGGPVM